MPAEDTTQYLASSGLTQLIQQLLEACCRKKPDRLAPFVVDELLLSCPSAAEHSKAVTSGATARLGKWITRSDVNPESSMHLEHYLDDIGWRPTVERVVELALISRPTHIAAHVLDVVVSMRGTDAGAAATRIQAKHRGNTERARKKKRQEAATRVQATHRGRAARRRAAKPKLESVREDEEAKPAAESGLISVGDGAPAEP